jgi:AcrR family transcriptional regulator
VDHLRRGRGEVRRAVRRVNELIDASVIVRGPVRVSMRTTSQSSPPRRRPGRPPGHDPRRPERLEQILEAACRAILERGFPATRIADIAAAARVSTGTVHSYFSTRDEVLVAALKWASARLFRRVEEPGDEPAAARLGHLLAVAVPYPGEAISEQWHGYFHDIVRRGAERGEFTPAAPWAPAGARA